MEKEVKKHGKKGKKLVIIFIILGLILLIGGGVLNYFSSPKYVTQKAIKNLEERVSGLLDEKTETGLEENFKTTGQLDINIKSDYFQGLASLDQSYAMISNFFNNLSNTQNNFTIVQDKENKRRMISYDAKLGEETLINMKSLIEDATEYYYIEGVTSSYVNDGNNNYFESLNSTTTTNENIKYIIEKVSQSLQQHIDDSYLSTSYNSTYKIVTLTLTEDNLVTLINNVLEDLKQDSKAQQIMTGYNENFSSIKVSKEDIEGIGTVKLNFYLEKILPNVVKYSLELQESTYTYSIENNQKVIEIKNNDTTTRFNITNNNEKTEITITDDTNTSLGNISISKTNTNYNILFHVADEESSMDIGYNSQLTNLEKGTSYDQNTTFTINLNSQGTTLIDGTITYNATTTNDTTIEEDTSNSVLASSLTEEQEVLISQKLTMMFTRLMS